MKFILFILITNNILYSQLDGFDETYKRQLQLGKIDKSKTEFFDKNSNVYSNYLYGFTFEIPKNWKTDNGTGLIDVFRTFKRDSLVTVKIGIMKSELYEDKSIFQLVDILGKEKFKSDYINRVKKGIGFTPNILNLKKIYFKNLPTLSMESLHTEKVEEDELEWYTKTLTFYKNDLQFSIGLTIPHVYYLLNSDYYDNLFYQFGFLQSYDDFEFLDENLFFINSKDYRKINTYDLKSMVKLFLDDCKLNGISISNKINISSTFEVLESRTLGVSLGRNNPDIIIKIDPESWSKSSIIKRWYLIYHELGHDVLNLKHGEGGKMMFTFSDREYEWKEFFDDKKYMFNYVTRN